MRFRFHALVLLAGVALTGLLLAGCGPEVEDDLRGADFRLLTADSTAVTFPDAFAGNVLVVGYIYTRCPDVCPLTTANMKAVQEGLADDSGVQFVSVSFDPERDTPSVLRRYRDAYRLDEDAWTFLTGDPATVDRMMERLGVRVAYAARSDSATIAAGAYFLDHTDQITLVDAQGRVRAHYGGSMTPPEFLIEDINALLRESA
jgi:protein SCO1/2